MTKRQPKKKTTAPKRRDENQSAFDAVRQIIERTESAATSPVKKHR